MNENKTNINWLVLIQSKFHSNSYKINEKQVYDCLLHNLIKIYKIMLKITKKSIKNGIVFDTWY